MSIKPLRCALLSSFTLDQLPPLVTERLQTHGVELQWYVGPFNQYPQLILDDTSELYTFAPQVVFLAVAIEDLLDNLPSRWSEPEERLDAANRRIKEFTGLLRQLSQRLPNATMFVHNFVLTQPHPHALLAYKSHASLEMLVNHANYLLADLSCELSNIFVLNLTDVFAEIGLRKAYDARYFYLARMRFSRAALEALAEYYQRSLLAYLGQRKKCIVLDLDNTLWGGILGEDGPEHLILGEDGPGKAFQDMQRILLDYYNSGTLLAICSKNDEELALSVIREHPGMVLRPHHFAAIRINWQDKASNIQAIAKDLNLGLDSFVFMDDSAFEREQVRYALPEVTVVDLPSDPSDYPAFVAQLPYFDTLAITDVDLKRGRMYAEDRQRRELQQKATSLQEFLRELDIRVILGRADRFALPRMAQLTQRTNQFNLTTRRYTENDLHSMLQDEGWQLYYVQASDRIGDNGIVGVAIVKLDRLNSCARLDTFLLSCRVLGRGIETAFLAGVLLDVRAAGISSIEAEFIPTRRNRVAQDFLPKHGFVFVRGIWQRSLAGVEALCPDWIDLQFREDST